MTHPMLEKVARAILAEIENEDGNGSNPDLAIKPDGSVDFIDVSYINMHAVARAAVQALLEPDEGQIADGAEIHSDMLCMTDDSRHDAREIYRAMLEPLLGDAK